jgi:hypothetical protein
MTSKVERSTASAVSIRSPPSSKAISPNTAGGW